MKERFFNSLFHAVLLVVICVIAGLRLYSWNTKTLLGNTLAMPFGYGITIVLSGSMQPELSIDDLVLIHRQDNYTIGDVIVYQAGDVLVIHRIVSIQGNTIITQGDANNVPDSPINLLNVKGKKVLSIPYLGGIVRFCKSSLGALVMLTVSVVSLVTISLSKRGIV